MNLNREGWSNSRPHAADVATGEPRRRRGWRLPTERRVEEAAQPLLPSGFATDLRERAEWQFPPQALQSSVFGQVTDVGEGTLQFNQIESALQFNKMSEPVVTFRLERNDPHAGRTFVANVRLRGSDALGFADVGDWVEAVGKQKSAYLVAFRCINHTTGAVYKNARRRIARALLVLIILVVMISIFLSTVSHLGGGVKSSAELRQESIDQCIKSGAPRSFCESIP